MATHTHVQYMNMHVHVPTHVTEHQACVTRDTAIYEPPSLPYLNYHTEIEYSYTRSLSSPRTNWRLVLGHAIMALELA